MDEEIFRVALSQLSGAVLAADQPGGFTITGVASGRVVQVSKSVSDEPCRRPVSYLLVVSGRVVAAEGDPDSLLPKLMRAVSRAGGDEAPTAPGAFEAELEGTGGP